MTRQGKRQDKELNNRRGNVKKHFRLLMPALVCQLQYCILRAMACSFQHKEEKCDLYTVYAINWPLWRVFLGCHMYICFYICIPAKRPFESFYHVTPQIQCVCVCLWVSYLAPVTVHPLWTWSRLAGLLFCRSNALITAVGWVTVLILAHHRPPLKSSSTCTRALRSPRWKCQHKQS